MAKNFFHPEQQEVNLTAGSTEDLSLTMPSAYGFLAVTSQPETGADVYIDGVKVGQTPYKSERLKTAEYLVQVV